MGKEWQQASKESVARAATVHMHVESAYEKTWVPIGRRQRPQGSPQGGPLSGGPQGGAQGASPRKEAGSGFDTSPRGVRRPPRARSRWPIRMLPSACCRHHVAVTTQPFPLTFETCGELQAISKPSPSHLCVCPSPASQPYSAGPPRRLQPSPTPEATAPSGKAPAAASGSAQPPVGHSPDRSGKMFMSRSAPQLVPRNQLRLKPLDKGDARDAGPRSPDLGRVPDLDSQELEPSYQGAYFGVSLEEWREAHP